MAAGVAAAPQGWLGRLNGRYHQIALNTFMVIVLAHWAEHITQAIQVWGLGWSRPKAKGLLGYAFPWLVTTEWMHYCYALVMLIALFALRPGFTDSTGTRRRRPSPPSRPAGYRLRHRRGHCSGMRPRSLPCSPHA